LRDLDAARVERRAAVRAWADRVARGERAAGAGQDDRADVRVGVRDVEGLVELFGHPRRDRVERVRPVQRDRGDVTGLVVQDFLVGHGSGPPGEYTSRRSIALASTPSKGPGLPWPLSGA